MIFEFLLAAIVIELTPGPNMTWIALLGASRGRLAALVAVMGVTLGLTITATACIFGVDTLITTQPWIFELLRFIGFAYLIYLAWDAWYVSEEIRKERFNEPSSRYFKQGLLTNMLNPKAYLFYAVVLPQFVLPNKSLMIQLITLSVIYISIATCIHIIIALLAGKAAEFFNNDSRIKFLGHIFAVLLILTAFWFLLETK